MSYISGSFSDCSLNHAQVIIKNQNSTRNSLVMIVLTKWVETFNTYPHNHTTNMFVN